MRINDGKMLMRCGQFFKEENAKLYMQNNFNYMFKIDWEEMNQNITFFQRVGL